MSRKLFKNMIEEFQTNKKLNESGVLKCTPGGILEKCLFIDLFYIKILDKSDLHFKASFYMARVGLPKLKFLFLAYFLLW